MPAPQKKTTSPFLVRLDEALQNIRTVFDELHKRPVKCRIGIAPRIASRDNRGGYWPAAGTMQMYG